MFFILKAIIILLIAIVAIAAISARYFRIERRPDEVLFANTEDGWKLALSRYHAIPQKGQKKKRLPILICHGLSGNHFAWDFTERLSLARTLAAKGYEVFLLDLRGAGWSDRPGFGSAKSWNWDFETYLDKDIPAAIEKVLEVTGEKTLHYIGHSMGGMLAYCFLQREIGSKVKSTTILSSPLRLDQYAKLTRLVPFMKLLPVFYIGTFARFGSFFGEFMPSVQKYSGNLELARGHTSLSLANTVDNVPTTLMMQFISFVEKGKVVLKDGTDIPAGLPDIKTPMMFIVGCDDLTIMPVSVQETYEAVGSKKKEFHMLGPDNGQACRYGHQSVQYGRNADTEVYPLIIDWLEKN